jgi:metallo-beta-lactamase family protein
VKHKPGGIRLHIKLSFLGGTQNVTGSLFLLETDNTRLLIDCGMYQERKFKNRNWEPFPFRPDSIDAVLLTHAHIDHCGLIPKLVRDGFRGRIYCTTATFEITQIILLDAAHLHEEDAEYKKRRHERENRKGPFPEVPLYTIEDAKASFPYFTPVNYGEVVPLGEGLKATFRDAGHVLGSSMIKITVNQQGEIRNILFSGDVGRWDRPILRDPSVFKEIDYAIIESTYGDRVHEESPDISDKLAEIVNSTWQARGNVIIPSFALQRSQEILYYMNELLMDNRIPHIMVFLDSPMAINITEVYKRHSELYDKAMSYLVQQRKSPFNFPGLKMVQTTEESKALNHILGTIVIIAGSGMCTGGRIKHHLVTNITRPESTILFVGYQAMGTLGRRIVDGAKRVRILGQYYPVKARVVQISGFSAHADRNELLRWISGITPRRVFIIHGEPKAASQFSRFLKEQTGWNVTAPVYGKSVILD